MSGRPKTAPFAALRATWWKEYPSLSWQADAVFARLLSYCADCAQGGRFREATLYQIAAGRTLDVAAVLAELEAERLVIRSGAEWAIVKWSDHNAHLAAAAERRAQDRKRKEEKRADERMSAGHSPDIAADTSGTISGSPSDNGRDVRSDISGSVFKLTSSDPESDARAAEGRVFEHWRSACRKPRSARTPIRMAKIKARLADCGESRCIAAINGNARTEWYRRNGHDDIELILRSVDNVERFERFLDAPPENRGMAPAAPHSAFAHIDDSNEAIDRKLGIT